MEKVRCRGRPPKPKEGDLLAQLERKKKTKENIDKFLLRLTNRMSNKKGAISMSDIKYLYKPRSQAMFDVKKYDLWWTDPIIIKLREQCKKPPSIGILSLTELEVMSGALPQGGETERKLLDGMEYMTASLVYANEKYIDRVTAGYWQYDLNSAYGWAMVTNRMPTTLKWVYDGKYYPKDDEVAVYVDRYNQATFDFYDMELKVEKTYVYNTMEYGKEFVDKWFTLKQQEKYKKLAKDVMVCAIGAIHKYRQNLIARYIWYKVRQFMYDCKLHVERRGGIVGKIHTDGIGYFGKEALFVDSPRLGEFKLEHKDKRIYMVSAGQYQVEGKKPRLSGINWGGTWIEKQTGERIHYTIFPCIKLNDVIKSYEKDGVEWKTLGADITFEKGGE